MCKLVEDLIIDATEEATKANKIETARRFLDMNLTVEQVAAGTGLSVQEVEALSSNRSA